ncbi:MAG TPA: saccharopine dehydrogenase [Acidobacteria bacterium]|nr:saccharopine dehydrogenase [Acidobacteriota bacterium]
MNNILVLGAGRVARPLIRYLLARGSNRVVAASLRANPDVVALLESHPHGAFLEADATDTATLRPLVIEADAVVGLLPSVLNTGLARLCVEERRPFINTSYTPPAMLELDAEAQRNGVLLLNEVGLDPGIDHMSAVRMIRRVRAAGGTVERFMSCCGGLPAPDANTNPWGYKFSWHPRGVLLAGRQSARYLRGGEIVEIEGPDLFDHRWRYEVEELGTFEIYPNRDSLAYLEAYRLDGAEGFFRGTIRYPGWCETLRAVAALGLLDLEERPWPDGMTWADLAGRQGGDAGGAAAERVGGILGVDPDDPVIARLEWAGLLSNRTVGGRTAAPLDLLAERLQKLMFYRRGERDMVVLKHTLTASFPDGSTEILTSRLVALGDPWGDQAMARTVGLPAAIATQRVVAGKISATGVQIPVLPEIAEPVLDELQAHGFSFKESSLTMVPGPLDLC